MDPNEKIFTAEKKQTKTQSQVDFNKFFKNFKGKKGILALALLYVVILGLSIYFGFLSFSIHSSGLKFFLVFTFLYFGSPYFFAEKHNRVKKSKLPFKISTFVALSLIGVLIVLSFVTSPLFLSEKYRNIIDVNEEADFSSNVENFSEMKIPIVDYALADKLGDKKLGEDNLGSQFTISQYSMIYYQNDIYWVGALEYTGFFKWLNQKSDGSPGYVKISATNPSDVEIVKKPMKFIPSAFFGQNMSRKLYFSNMTKFMSDDYSFELDENGTPYFVKAVFKNKFAAVNGLDADGVAVLNAQTGESDYFEIGAEPAWLDKVVHPSLVVEQMNYHGRFVHGFWNTVFAKKEIISVSEDYNYILNDGKFYFYTSMTSIGSDESMVGVVMSDAKTKETFFYKLGGATEWAAQQSAEGVVQDLKYRASFPMIINYLGEPTYFMTLKDQEGLIKKYAYVNVKDYSKVGIGDTMNQAQVNYSQVVNVGQSTTETLAISQIVPVVKEGSTYYYMTFEGKSGIFIAHISLSDSLPFLKEGDKVNVKLSTNLVVALKVETTPTNQP